MIKAIINTIEYDLLGKFSIQEKLGNVISTNLNVRVLDGQRIPRAGDIIRVKDTTTLITYFIGVAGIPKSPTYNNFNEVKIYKIKCLNANAILKRRLFNYAANNVTIAEVVQEIFDTIISAEGISLGTISNITTSFDTYVSPNIDVQKVLNELADKGIATWSINSDYEFNFIVIDDFPKFDTTIDTGYIFGDKLKHKTTGLDVRTVQIIEGGTEETLPQTQNFVYNGTDDEFIVRFPIQSKPIIKVNTVALDPSRVGVKGLDDGDASVYFLFSYNSPSVSYNSLSAFLSVSDDVQIIYVGAFEIRIEAANQSRIDELATLTGTSGIIENIINDSSIKTSLDGQSLADSLLNDFEFERDEVSWRLITPQLKKFGLTLNDFPLNTEINFDLPDIGLEGDFVIVERKIEPFSLEDVVENLVITLKLQNRNLLRSYGETFNSLERQLASISVRENQIIIQAITSTEIITMSEILALSVVNAFHPTASGSGPLFAPDYLDGQGGAFPI